MNKQKILVTGGLGFIGSHLVDSLVDQGHDVWVVDDLSTGLLCNQNPHSTVIIETVQRFCQSNVQRFDIIFHFANNARIARSFEYCKETMLNNYNSVVEICEYIKDTDINTKLIFASSSTTEFADRYNNPYTFSKIACDEILELYHKHFDLKYDIVKFYNVYGSERETLLGEYTTVIRKFKHLYDCNRPLVIYGDGEQMRDFTHIDDTIDALNIIKDLPASNMHYRIGTGTAVSINTIAEAFQHPCVFKPAREYEVSLVYCVNPNVPGWKAEQRLVQHIKEWVKHANH